MSTFNQCKNETFYILFSYKLFEIEYIFLYSTHLNSDPQFSLDTFGIYLDINFTVEKVDTMTLSKLSKFLKSEEVGPF